jgi:hypothetical protein
VKGRDCGLVFSGASLGEDMARRTKQQPPSRTATPATIAQRRARIVRIGEAFPDAVVDGKQHLSFTVRGKRFAWCLDDHHGDGRVALNCKASPGTNSALAEVHPDRFHIPAYLGSKGWVGLWLDLGEVDWDEVSELMRDAYMLVAPKGKADTVAGRPRGRRMPPRPSSRRRS